MPWRDFSCSATNRRGNQATNPSFGVVNAPGRRYHPAIIAQVIQTLRETALTRILHR